MRITSLATLYSLEARLIDRIRRSPDPLPAEAWDFLAERRDQIPPLEIAVLLGPTGEPLRWYVPADATENALPDHEEHFADLAAHRDQVTGIAHLHPWAGPAQASGEDRSTFRALDNAFGTDWIWIVATWTEARVYRRIFARTPGEGEQRNRRVYFEETPAWLNLGSPAWLKELRLRGGQPEKL